MSSLVRTQALNYSLVMNGVILGDNDDGDHVPELGVRCVDVQPLQDEIKCRTHVHKVPSLCPLKLYCDVLYFPFLNFRFVTF